LDGIDAGGELLPQAREQVQELLRRQFRPEFLNRLDDIVFYRPLSREDIGRIADLMLEGLKKRLAERQLNIEVTERARAHLIERGYDPSFGARPMRRYIQQHVETLIARRVIASDPEPGSVITVDEENGELVAR
ncbi:MAG: type VI secretion system ATPase TssH, partial [Clostridia bacterium]|nr:type VI secretion system ATPase TssH [Clostridia bacterium]